MLYINNADAGYPSVKGLQAAFDLHQEIGGEILLANCGAQYPDFLERFEAALTEEERNLFHAEAALAAVGAEDIRDAWETEARRWMDGEATNPAAPRLGGIVAKDTEKVWAVKMPAAWNHKSWTSEPMTYAEAEKYLVETRPEYAGCHNAPSQAYIVKVG